MNVETGVKLSRLREDEKMISATVRRDGYDL